MSYDELETRIYEWGMELDASVRCFQTNHEGATDRLVPRDPALGGRDRRQSRRLDALQLRDPGRRGAAVGAGRRGPPVQHRRAGGMAPAFGDRGRRRRTGSSGTDRRGTARLSSGWRRPNELPARTGCAGLLGELEVDAFLVTNGTNVRYLTWFRELERRSCSSIREGAVLLTDGRYVEAAARTSGGGGGRDDRTSPGRSWRAAGRARHADGSASRRPRSRLRPTRSLPAAASSSSRRNVPSNGSVRSRTLRSSTRYARPPDRGRPALRTARGRARRRAVRGRARPGGSSLALRDLGAEDVSFAPIVASGPNAARPHHRPGDRLVGGAARRSSSTRAASSVGTAPTARARSRRGRCPRRLSARTRVCLEAQLATLEAVRPGAVCEEVDAIARRMVGDAGYTVYHNVGHSRRARDPRGSSAREGLDETLSGRARRDGGARRSTCRASAASASRIS